MPAPLHTSPTPFIPLSFSHSLSPNFPCHFHVLWLVFFRSLNLFQCQSFLTCFSVIHLCLSGMQRALVSLSQHTHTPTLLYLMLTSCTLPYSCAGWHWDIRILKFKATNGRLLMLSTNTYHTQAPNLFISFKSCACVYYEYMMPGYHKTISWWRNPHPLANSTQKIICQWQWKEPAAWLYNDWAKVSGTTALYSPTWEAGNRHLM